MATNNSINNQLGSASAGAVVTSSSSVMSSVNGTSGHVLTSNGAGSAPSFQAAGTSVTITGDSGSATSSNITLTGGSSGAVFTGSSATITQTFNYLSMAATSSTNGQVKINSERVLSMPVDLTNIFAGARSGSTSMSGQYNSGLGQNALGAITSGNYNCAFGYLAGQSLTTGSSNIYVNNGGAAAENNTMRIGVGTGGGNQQLNKSFIHGIRGITTVNNDAINVLVDSAGQLGTVSSSIRYKENIEDMGDMSSPILNLRPVTFDFIDRPSHKKQVGLIAEETLEIMPSLVVYNNEGEVESVKYHDLPVLLLNEIKKSIGRIDILEKKVKERYGGE